MALILLVLGVLGIGVVAVAWWSLPDVLGEHGKVQLRPAKAKVVESAPCGAAAGRDLVEVRVDGEVRQAPFDGCGHTRGQQLKVQIPVDSGEEFVVRPDEPDTVGAQDRVTWVLLTLAAVAGGGYALLLRSRRVEPASEGAIP